MPGETGFEAVAEHDDDRAQRLRDALALLEELVADREPLGLLDDDERRRFLEAAGDVFGPDAEQRRQRSRPGGARRRPRSARGRRRCSTRRASAPCGPGRCSRRRTCSSRRSSTTGDAADEAEARLVTATRGGAALLRLQGRLLPSPPLLRPDVPAVRRAQLRQAHRDRRPRGRVALLTGGRVKIGYQAGIKLLRAGASLIVTTRFPRDAAPRYAAEADFADWGDRLGVVRARPPPHAERRGRSAPTW